MNGALLQEFLKYVQSTISAVPWPEEGLGVDADVI